jgi:hypothetical protein
MISLPKLFYISCENSQDNTTQFISHLGYVLVKALFKNNDFTIVLTPSIFELNDVNVSNKSLMHIDYGQYKSEFS